MADKVVARPKRAKSEKPAVLAMTSADIHETLSTMRWLDNLPARPSDGDIDVLRVEAIGDWIREAMFDHPGGSYLLSIPTRQEIRKALAEHRATNVIDFTTAAARVRKRREPVANIS